MGIFYFLNPHRWIRDTDLVSALTVLFFLLPVLLASFSHVSLIYSNSEQDVWASRE